jgi:hypothetical protein
VRLKLEWKLHSGDRDSADHSNHLMQLILERLQLKKISTRNGNLASDLPAETYHQLAEYLYGYGNKNRITRIYSRITIFSIPW